jgi:hypothetical protein
MDATEPRTSFTTTFAGSEHEPGEIRSQLERILAHPQFRNSKRYPALLRHVVERALEGRADSLKERTIGIELFGREPDYDTNLDHTVRTSAGEVRKRLAQYYVESNRDDEIRIDLPAGSYVPQFRRHRQREQEKPTPGAFTALVKPELGESPVPGLVRRRTMILLSVSAIALTAVAAWASTNWLRPSAFDQFWAPVGASTSIIMLCIGPAQPKDAELDQDAPRTLLEVHRDLEKVAFFDAVTLGRFTALLAEKRKRFRTVYSPQISLADLRQGPVILIGAFDNDWTLRLTGPLRYRFQRDAEFNIAGIRDDQNPSQTDWQVDWRTPYSQLTEDYALVSRVSDPTTGETVIVAAGITKYGTLAAGEFLTGSRLEELARYAPADWKRKNLQVVLSTKVVKGSPGPPHIVAAHFW